LIFKGLPTNPIDFDWCKLTKKCGFDNAKTRLPEEFCSSKTVILAMPVAIQAYALTTPKPSEMMPF
jgi:hypothetical protein